MIGLCKQPMNDRIVPTDGPSTLQWKDPFNLVIARAIFYVLTAHGMFGREHVGPVPTLAVRIGTDFEKSAPNTA